MLLRIALVAIVCIWCVTSETVSKTISNHLDKNETQSKAKKEAKVEMKVDLKIAENTRSARQLDPGAWSPIPAIWSPRPRSPLNTWWATPWPNQGPHSLVRIRPPSPYWEDYNHEPHYWDYYHHHEKPLFHPDKHHHYHHDKHHDEHHDHHDVHHHHDHHDDHHHHEHKPLPPPPIPPHPATLPYIGRPGLYIAQNGGAIHIAPLPGHADSVISSNLQPAAGTVPGPWVPPFGPGIAVDISGLPGAIPPPPPVSPRLPPPVPPQLPPPVPPRPGPFPFGRTW